MGRICRSISGSKCMVVDNSDVNQEQVDAMVALVREAAMKALGIRVIQRTLKKLSIK